MGAYIKFSERLGGLIFGGGGLIFDGGLYTELYSTKSLQRLEQVARSYVLIPLVRQRRMLSFGFCFEIQNVGL